MKFWDLFVLTSMFGKKDEEQSQNMVSINCLENNEFDYIVVGSGSTGGVVAPRLSETDGVRVLLIEAGKEPTHISEIPLISFHALHSEMDWNYTSVPQITCCLMHTKRQLPIFRGKALGGTSSLNFMTNTKGFPEDYNSWRDQGNEGWGWDDLFPYILKQEGYKAPIPNPENVPYHGTDGPMTVEIPTFKTPMAGAFLEAGGELGYPNDIDYNARDSIGFMYPPVNTRNFSRCSTYTAYIKPAMKRENFVVEKESLVTKILIDENKVATGVMYLKDGKTCTASASREVIVSAGVIGSPKLLMLSGIGPKKHLQSKGIPVIQDLPGVGQNYQDHVVMGAIQYEMNDTVTYNSVRYETPENIELWEYNRTGPMQCPESFEGVAYVATDNSDSKTWPDIEIFFNADNVARVLKPDLRKLLHPFITADHVDMISFLPILLRPKSRGVLTLASSDPLQDPLIDPRLLSHPQDLDTLRKGVMLSTQLSQTKAFKRYGSKPMTPWNLGTSCSSHLTQFDKIAHFENINWLSCAMQLLSTSGFHPAGTCKMGPTDDSMAVVDNKLRVRGIQHLRVADASIMPTVVASHTSIPCVVIGEKIADDIKQDWGDPINTVTNNMPRER